MFGNKTSRYLLLSQFRGGRPSHAPSDVGLGVCRHGEEVPTRPCGGTGLTARHRAHGRQHIGPTKASRTRRALRNPGGGPNSRHAAVPAELRINGRVIRSGGEVGTSAVCFPRTARLTRPVGSCRHSAHGTGTAACRWSDLMVLPGRRHRSSPARTRRRCRRYCDQPGPGWPPLGSCRSRR